MKANSRILIIVKIKCFSLRFVKVKNCLFWLESFFSLLHNCKFRYFWVCITSSFCCGKRLALRPFLMVKNCSWCKKLIFFGLRYSIMFCNNAWQPVPDVKNFFTDVLQTCVKHGKKLIPCSWCKKLVLLWNEIFDDVL